MQRLQSPRAFVLLELVVLVVLILVGLAIASVVIEALRPRHGGHRSMQNSTQLRGIHQGLVMYAQGNKSKFPGLNADGTDGDLSVENRFAIMLRNNYFTGEYAISPSEAKTAWTTGPVTSAHYSYAMLQIPPEGGRRTEWSETLNTEAAVVGDRNLGTAAAPSSVWSHPGDPWRGSVLWNDNHVGFESTHVVRTNYGGYSAHLPDGTKQYVGPTNNPSDHLFDAAGVSDALLIHSGN